MALSVAGCATRQSSYVRLGQAYPPRPNDSDVRVLRTDPVDEACQRISRLDVHLERTGLVGSDLDDALPALKREARASGADAIAEISERRSTVGETRIYHVTGIGLRCGPPP